MQYSISISISIVLPRRGHPFLPQGDEEHAHGGLEHGQGSATRNDTKRNETIPINTSINKNNKLIMNKITPQNKYAIINIIHNLPPPNENPP